CRPHATRRRRLGTAGRARSARPPKSRRTPPRPPRRRPRTPAQAPRPSPPGARFAPPPPPPSPRQPPPPRPPPFPSPPPPRFRVCDRGRDEVAELLHPRLAVLRQRLSRVDREDAPHPALDDDRCPDRRAHSQLVSDERRDRPGDPRPVVPADGAPCLRDRRHG